MEIERDVVSCLYEIETLFICGHLLFLINY